MTPFARNTSLLVARTSLALLMLGFTVCLVWTAGDLLGQAPAQKKRAEEEEAPKTKAKAGKKRVEEEEEAPRKKPRRKVIRVEEEEDSKDKKAAAPRPSGPAAGGDLAQLADRETQPAIKALYRSLAVPYDLVLYKRTKGVTNSGEKVQREEKIVPTPYYIGDDPDRLLKNNRLVFTPYSLDWQPDPKKLSPLPGTLEFVHPYEKIAQDKVRSFLRNKTPEVDADSPTALTRYDKLRAAEQVLSSVLNWHLSEKQAEKKRIGKEWDAVEASLRKQLLDEVLLEQMKELARVEDWNGVMDLAHRLAVTYKDKQERMNIFRPVADMLDRTLIKQNATISDKKRQEALERLHELEKEFPDADAFQPIAKSLEKEAQSYLDAANELADNKKLEEARTYLNRARRIYPQLEGIGKLEGRLNLEHPILRVGVRGSLPKYFSPSWACTENERRAVELLFESLVKVVPDKAGGFCYRRGMSESYPQVVRLGRQFELPRGAVWSDGRHTLNYTDIQYSLKLLQLGKGVGRSRVWGDLLLSAESKNDPCQVTLTMRQGFLDPLALMTFKILPCDQYDNEEKFAVNPITSGPYLLKEERSDEDNRSCRIFLANPSYKSRTTRNGAPHIQEIRFYSYSDAVKELSDGKLDLVLDLRAKEAQELQGKQSVEVPMPSASVPNRRIYFLAINTSKFPKEVRQALSAAIDREKLLNTHFRAAPNAPVHKVLTGPFPAGAWAGKPDKDDKAEPKLFNPDAAKLLKAHPAVRQAAKDGPWKLNYPAGDEDLAKAMKALCDQVKDLTGVELRPEPLLPYQLREDVEITKKYAVAYYYYDFPDETFWLGPLFGPPPGLDDENIFKYENSDLTKLLDGMKTFRNFAEVRKHQWETHELLNRELPFIPLWQLDPLLAYRRDVQPETLDPQLPFRNIEEWHLLRK